MGLEDPSWRRPQNGKTTYFFALFCIFFKPGTSARGFSRPCHRISRQKCVIWMRICRVTVVFVVFEKFGIVLRVLEVFFLIWKLSLKAELQTRVRALRAKTRTFSAIFQYIWPLAGPNIAKRGWGCGLEGYVGRIQNFCGDLKGANLDFLDFRPKWVILNNFFRSSSFTGSVGLIIDSSRSVTCLSSCLASSIYFFHGKGVSLSWVQLPFVCVATTPKLISGPCSIEKYPFSRMANRYTRIFGAGWSARCRHFSGSANSKGQEGMAEGMKD